MSRVVVVGAQWGDEGKGKIVDYIAESADLVVRYAGGPEGDRAVVDGAKAMAATIVDLWAEPGALEEAQAAFAADRESGRATGSPTI